MSSREGALVSKFYQNTLIQKRILNVLDVVHCLMNDNGVRQDRWTKSQSMRSHPAAAAESTPFISVCISSSSHLSTSREFLVSPSRAIATKLCGSSLEMIISKKLICTLRIATRLATVAIVITAMSCPSSSMNAVAFKWPQIITARTCTAATTMGSGSPSKATSTIGPINILANAGGGFQWQAWLNNATGIAGSMETSSLSMMLPSSTTSWSQSKTTKSPSSTQQAKHWYKNVQYQQQIHSISHHLVSSWSDFICQGSVSLGLLQTSKVSKETTVNLSLGETKSYELSKRDDSFGTSIHPRFIRPLSLLTFGKPRRLSKSWNSWEIPIEGGLLSVMNSDTKVRGKLIFEIIKKGNDDTHVNYILKSQIVDYTPRISGNPPVSKVRKWIYLHSQSLVHGYVTWRFHRSWKQKLNKFHREFTNEVRSSSYSSSASSYPVTMKTSYK